MTAADQDNIQGREWLEGVTAILAAPLVLPLSAATEQPLLRELIKQGMVFSERCQEAIATAQERFEDLQAEARDVVQTETPPQGNAKLPQELLTIANELNTQTLTVTNGWVDLKMLVSLGFGAIALRQLLVKGFHPDAIPWYVLAWYAFDTFYKFNQEQGKENSKV
jgi:hypothetical protein